MCCTWLAENTGRKKSPSGSGPYHTTLLGCIFAIKARIDTRKKLVKQQHPPHHKSSQYDELGPLTAEIGSGVWCTPANFNGFRVLPSLVKQRRSPEANQTCTMFGRLLHFRGLLPRQKFTLRPTLAFSYMGSVTVLHSTPAVGVSRT